MRQKAARVCLVIAIVWFILGFFVLGNAPEWFVISAAFAALAALLGVRRVRMTGAVLVVASVVVAVGDYQAEQKMKARVREIRGKTADKTSSSVELYRWPNKLLAEDAGRAIQFAFGCPWLGTTEADRAAKGDTL